MKLNNEVLLVGVACLIVGGATGYLLSGQNQEEYAAKAFSSGIQFGCYVENDGNEEGSYACFDNAKQQHALLIEELNDPEYLTKKAQHEFLEEWIEIIPGRQLPQAPRVSMPAPTFLYE